MNSDSSSSQNNVDQTKQAYMYQPWVERNGFAHWAVAVAWVLIALVAFNILGGLVSLGSIVMTSNSLDMEVLMRELSSNYSALFLGNTTGQIVVMGLATFLVVRLHVSKQGRKSFLRLQLSNNVWQMTLLAALLFVVAQPAILFLGWLNSFVPVPEVMAEMQESMRQMIANFLKSDHALLIGVFHIGVVPAVCEEILYRGYVQRAFEKSWGITAAILISGAIFGAYHLQISSFLPLATLGVFLAYMTYISNSLIPAMVAHFVNNGGQVIASNYYPEMLDTTITPGMDLPVLLIILSVILSAGILYFMATLKPKNEEA